MKANNLFSIKQLYKSEIGMLMFKYHKELLRQAFENLFTYKPLCMKTRSNSQIISNYCKSLVAQQSLTYIGPKVWNEIPHEIKNCKTHRSFKRKLLQFFINFPI